MQVKINYSLHFVLNNYRFLWVRPDNRKLLFFPRSSRTNELPDWLYGIPDPLHPYQNRAVQDRRGAAFMLSACRSITTPPVVCFICESVWGWTANPWHHECTFTPHWFTTLSNIHKINLMPPFPQRICSSDKEAFNVSIITLLYWTQMSQDIVQDL